MVSNKPLLASLSREYELLKSTQGALQQGMLMNTLPALRQCKTLTPAWLAQLTSTMRSG
jgi:hypothetical protein